IGLGVLRRVLQFGVEEHVAGLARVSGARHLAARVERKELALEAILQVLLHLVERHGSNGAAFFGALHIRWRNALIGVRLLLLLFGGGRRGDLLQAQLGILGRQQMRQRAYQTAGHVPAVARRIAFVVHGFAQERLHSRRQVVLAPFLIGLELV